MLLIELVLYPVPLCAWPRYNIRYSMQHFVVRSTLIGVEHTPEGRRIVWLPAGSIVHAPENHINSGFIEVYFRSRTIHVFAEDLRDRGEHVPKQDASHVVDCN